MEDDPILFLNGRRPQNLGKMEDDLNFSANEKLPKCFGKWKTTSSLWLMEEDLNIFCNGR
jgi:hypothetical protein